MSEIIVKVCKDTIKKSNYKGLMIKASADGVNAKQLCDALYEWEQKSKANEFWVKESFEQKNVMAYAKIGTRYHNLGRITPELYSNYKKIYKK